MDNVFLPKLLIADIVFIYIYFPINLYSHFRSVFIGKVPLIINIQIGKFELS